MLLFYGSSKLHFRVWILDEVCDSGQTAIHYASMQVGFSRVQVDSDVANLNSRMKNVSKYFWSRAPIRPLLPKIREKPLCILLPQRPTLHRSEFCSRNRRFTKITGSTLQIWRETRCFIIWFLTLKLKMMRAQEVQLSSVPSVVWFSLR